MRFLLRCIPFVPVLLGFGFVPGLVELQAFAREYRNGLANDARTVVAQIFVRGSGFGPSSGAGTALLNARL